MSNALSSSGRTVVFISKATPGDDEFVLWLAPKLEAAGYSVFADILALEPGAHWRRDVTEALRDRAIKMLLCCRDSTLARDGVLEEIEIASELSKGLSDEKFIIPLRLEPYRKIFGIGGLQYIDFVRGWADGLSRLLDSLKRQKVPCDTSKARINPNWEVYRRRSAVPIKQTPERLTSSWLRVAHAPDSILYFEPSGAVDRVAMQSACNVLPYPAQLHGGGFFSFCSEPEINESLAAIGKFSIKQQIPLMQFIEEGSDKPQINKQDASNVALSMFRQAWDHFCYERGLLRYSYSKAVGFHISARQAKIGQRVPWGPQGQRGLSVLRNVAKGHVWQFGATGQPAFWPFPHFKLKSRVLFSPLNMAEAGEPIDDAKKQHRLRRSVCKGWRNKQWYGRMLAFLEVLSGDSAYIRLPLGAEACITLESSPILFTSPVSTELPNLLRDDEEETDTSTLGRPDAGEES